MSETVNAPPYWVELEAFDRAHDALVADLLAYHRNKPKVAQVEYLPLGTWVRAKATVHPLYHKDHRILSRTEESGGIGIIAGLRRVNEGKYMVDGSGGWGENQYDSGPWLRLMRARRVYLVAFDLTRQELVLPEDVEPTDNQTPTT